MKRSGSPIWPVNGQRPTEFESSIIETDVIHRGDDAAAFVVPWILRYTSIAEYKKN